MLMAAEDVAACFQIVSDERIKLPVLIVVPPWHRQTLLPGALLNRLTIAASRKERGRRDSTGLAADISERLSSSVSSVQSRRCERALTVPV